MKLLLAKLIELLVLQELAEFYRHHHLVHNAQLLRSNLSPMLRLNRCVARGLQRNAGGALAAVGPNTQRARPRVRAALDPVGNGHTNNS